MGRPANASQTRKVTISVSDQVFELLTRYAEAGIVGKNPAEVVERLVVRHFEDMAYSGKEPAIKLMSARARKK